ncbi:MAG: DUF3800 domain-containing protein [bacterium]
MLNKKEFRELNLSDETRIKIVDLMCDLISQLNIRIVNVVINKKTITTKSYDLLDRALTYSIQRIENDLKRLDPANKFLIITDEGRVGKMRKTARKIQKINFIPSKYGSYAYRKEIQALIEDPLPKSSAESYFIQLADIVAYIVYLYAIVQLGVGKFHNRIPKQVDRNKIFSWMDMLIGSLNLEASSENEYGVVCYPK